jgi:hypothetical protein
MVFICNLAGNNKFAFYLQCKLTITATILNKNTNLTADVAELE